jgi:TetR/AcrR family transcriptional regulator, regulator of cefoperazone and chloramphenicol sensitivity
MGFGNDSSTRGPYESPIRREQAEMTRSRIIDAARTLFLKRGYARTSLKQIAAEAGVSDQTIYAVFGKKPGLLQAIMDEMDLAAGVEQSMADIAAAHGDPERQLVHFVAYDRRLFEREGDNLLIMRNAGSSEPELAETLRSARERGRQVHLRIFSIWEAEGQLVESLNAGTAADLYHAVSSMDSFDYLVHERGWTADDWEQETFRVLCGALLRSPEKRATPSR